MTKAFRLFAPWVGPRDATGALRRGGRWNSPGTAVLYAASSLSLACLEILVHLRHIENLPEYSYAEVLIPDSHVQPWLGEELLYLGQVLLESEVLSREFGDRWIARRGRVPGTPPVLQVPSVVIPQEWNYIIDPDDPMTALQWSVPKPFHIDPRLIDPALR